MRISDRRFALYLMAPAALFLAVFVAWPLFRLVADSFFKISPIAGGPRDFVGPGQLRPGLRLRSFMGAGWRTLAYTLMVVTLEFALGLGMALLFTALGRSPSLPDGLPVPADDRPARRRPAVAIPADRQLRAHRHPAAPAEILQQPEPDRLAQQPDIVLFSVAIPDIWLTTSFMTLVLFAGLQNVPGDLIEAARLDGARRPTLLFRIILPLLRPVIAVALIVRGIDAARAFDIILIQTNGGPQSASETLSLLIYRTMIRFGDPGLASAMGTIYLMAMLAVAVVAVATIWRPGKDN